MLKSKNKEKEMGSSHSHARLKDVSKSEGFMPLVSQFFEKNVICLSEGDSVLDAAKLMVEHHIGNIVVTEDKNGKSYPVGIVTDRDIVVCTIAEEKEAKDVKLSELLEHKGEIVTASEDDSIADLVKLMVDEGISRLPIVDESGNLSGIVTSKRLFQFFAQGLCELSAISKKQQKNEEKMH